MLFAFSVCSGLFILTPVSDREHKLRYLLTFVGMKPSAYYFGNLMCDFMLFIIPTILFIALLYPLNLTFLYRGWFPLLGIMLSFGFSLITLTYLASFFFKTSNYAFNKIGIWYMILGIALPAVITLLISLALIASRHPEDYLIVWMYILLIDPFLPLSIGIIQIV